MQRFRVSAISYLNTAPLMWDFDHGEAGAAFDVTYTLPAQCAVALGAAKADIGIIPAAAYANLPGLAILPGIAIASRQAVRSILLVSKVPVEKVRSIALDTSSLTSVALTKVLCAKWWNIAPEFAPMQPDVDSMLAAHDAALLIGDPALQIDRTRHITYDLGEEWARFTGKPFVFAFWAVRSEILKGEVSSGLAAVFQQSRDHGLLAQNIGHIVRDWSARLSIGEHTLQNYLTSNIFYYLDDACLEGLQLFYRYSRECGALPAVPALRFLDAARPAFI